MSQSQENGQPLFDPAYFVRGGAEKTSIDFQIDIVPTATHYRWQRRAQQQLADFLAHGAKHNLPPLLWTLATTGALTGEADMLSNTPDQQREAVKRWAAHVGAHVETRTTGDGREELFAGWTKPVKGAADLHGCFRATILLDDETPQPESR
ncbi:hypothetical protein M1P56_35645 (plasmid) [Streptomyces sp. HU2014]|uniref:hypothetical protein n=1 Tax=Streptomyces sp. HU2014 TaxID=2939414 RepID=UPI00200D1D80|nr:hypothetical protein [Streptomyces sp. HU2014]UQI49826.1 hypothetical protein M1P56_35645 [Streptomyces sp. HU2014]